MSQITSLRPWAKKERRNAGEDKENIAPVQEPQLAVVCQVDAVAQTAACIELDDWVLRALATHAFWPLFTQFNWASDLESNNSDDGREEEDLELAAHKELWHNINSRLPPGMDKYKAALVDISTILWPPRLTGNGYKDPGLDEFYQT
ncbi:hypothetical protein BDN71DRAFT_1427168 [Pleurotus eryngii]|uniref:Uncharacterized protein n=1 Tax=Pleurotus eryngii TaxID=5323 RepID=A0A9P6A834_PLEER|nr:hypothetical protein BDN71DRAFT_1427168 [Pleurotus eryngii]